MRLRILRTARVVARRLALRPLPSVPVLFQTAYPDAVAG